MPGAIHHQQNIGLFCHKLESTWLTAGLMLNWDASLGLDLMSSAAPVAPHDQLHKAE